MKNGDSQKVVCSSDEMIEDGYSDEDMGDADSDIIYLEGFRISDEMESEDDEEELDDDEQELDDDEFEADNYNQSLEAGGAEGNQSTIGYQFVLYVFVSPTLVNASFLIISCGSHATFS